MTREQLIETLSDIRAEYNCFDPMEQQQYHALSEAIEALTERKTGKWIIEIEEEHTEKYDARIPHWFCSCCRTEYDPYSATRVNYCSNCGAKLEI